MTKWMLLALFVVPFLVPEAGRVPVRGATRSDWNPKSFWHEPWGPSGVHKGVDIFAKRGTPVVAGSAGLVLFTGEIAMGGRVVLVLGPKYRLHYHAHLDTIDASAGAFVRADDIIGRVGDSGNARGKPSHLHYSIVSLVPYFWRADRSTQGWKKMFFLDPIATFARPDAVLNLGL